jgi:hypothetical protein
MWGPSITGMSCDQCAEQAGAKSPATAQLQHDTHRIHTDSQQPMLR